MGKIFFLSGKSSTGKDTIYKIISEDDRLSLRTIIMYTTRPMREGERDGVEYHFVTEQEAKVHENDGSLVEMRVYNTVYGPWKYYTRNDGQIDIAGPEVYIAIGTLEAYEKFCAYYGKENVCPIYIEVDDGIRLRRALDREQKQAHPQYREMCRRFIADDDDFSEANLEKCGIRRRFVNDNLTRCINEITQYISDEA